MALSNGLSKGFPFYIAMMGQASKSDLKLSYVNRSLVLALGLAGPTVVYLMVASGKPPDKTE